jgi:hypothetical protein
MLRLQTPRWCELMRLCGCDHGGEAGVEMERIGQLVFKMSSPQCLCEDI